MSRSADADVIVVGAGVMGAATTWALARAGRRVLLLERFELGHARGSSHGPSRVFRFSYDDPMYVRMAMEAQPLWREIESDSGERLLTTLGGLDVGTRLDAHARALAECGAPFELIDGREARVRFPRVSVPDGPVLFQPDAGIVEAERAVRAFVGAAVSRGAVLREHERVVRLEPSADGVRVVAEDATYAAAVAVVTAGAWARGLLASASIDLPVTPSRQTVAYFAAADEMRLPVVVDWSDPLVYCLPSPGLGIKAGAHDERPPTDPDEDGIVNEATVRLLSDRVAALFPEVKPRAASAETCLYTNTSDERFILERRGPVVVGSPCSGHGFKFAPLIGRRLGALTAVDA